ncbi:MAG: tripartite tricarboxylate transporter substrate binding protein [Burkholderiales bacterium]|nr:tripartite tricarboxylate transporter substrate binding protein [Burkholderiales bacterium]
MSERSARRILVSLTIAATLAPVTAGAQGWKPERPVEIIVPSTPGGGLDRTGRLLVRVMQERKLSDQPVNVVNKPGGTGAVALAYLSQHAGDAHFGMIVGQALLTNHIMGRSRLHHSEFTPLAIVNVEYVALSVRAESPLKSAKEVIERLRKDPGALSVAVGTGIGTATQTAYAHAMFAAGVDVKRIKQVTFGSGGESMAALLGGHIDASSSPVSSIIANLRAGRVRVLAVSAPQRRPGDLAEVPAWNELGVKSAVEVWRALAGPRGLTAAQIAYWDAATARVVADPEWKKELERSLADAGYRNSAATAEHWRREEAEMRALYTELGLAKQ